MKSLTLKIKYHKQIRFAIFILSFMLIFTSSSAYAQKKTKPKEKVLTKGEAIMLLTATDFVKKKIGALLSWSIGYDISKVSRVKLIPTIGYVKASPRKTPPDGRTIVEIIASVDDPGGLTNISGVRADLTSLGRLSNTTLVDNGLFGDKKAEDGIYTLQTTVSPKIKLGVKEVQVAVANKKGWLAMAKTSLDVKKNPVIIGAEFVPERVKADGRQMVTLRVMVDNPGRITDLGKVTADLSDFGYTEVALLRNDGQGGDAVAKDDVFTLQFTVPKFVAEGDYKIKIAATNISGGYIADEIVLGVYK